MAVKENVYEYLDEIRKKATNDIKSNYNGYENYIVKTVKHFNKDIELVNKKTKKVEKIDLTIVEFQDPDNLNEIRVLYYLNGEEVNYTDILIEYETEKPIRDVINKSKENKEKPKKEQEDIQDLEELEAEKKQEEKGETKNTDKKDEKEESKNDLTGKKPKYVIQTIDIDKAYIDNWTTVRRGFNLPAGVEKIAIATPMQKDDNILSSSMTMYMLDNRGNILENVNGKTIKEFFEIDDATGNNPMYDDNTKLELGKYAEKNKGQTMMRFKSKQNPDLYLSAEQKKVGQYVEVYAGRKTMNGNDPVEVQLETDNVGIQTSLEMQQIISGYKGIYNKENIDKEADIHEDHGDDKMKIAKENADGKRTTIEICESSIIPGTDKTWEELSTNRRRSNKITRKI